MTSFNLNELNVEISSAFNDGVSFAGKGLKLDNACSAEPVVSAINNCKSMHYLNLEGNTLGVEAAEAISKALEKHSEFKKALWKDLFTGRMKTEIPKALQFLGAGMIKAHARLTVLDLSDNAFGPNGMEGLVVLLGSPCYALEELRLNNNGLGIGGGRMLAKALLDCHANSKAAGKPLSLKVFVAGRNRLENEGSKALAEVFKTLGTLEEVSMPQNGIYAPGITALSEAFAVNKNLRVLNLNDNTIGEKGAKAIAKALPHIQQLEELNFGDCLLKTAGAMSLAGALKEGHTKLETVVLGFNEINATGGVELVEVLHDKSSLKSVVLDGNQFGEEGKQRVTEAMRRIGREEALESLSEDEGEPEDEDESGCDSDEVSEESEDEYPDAPVITPTSTPIAASVKPRVELATPKFQVPSLNTSARTNIFSPIALSKLEDKQVNVQQFLSNPSSENFLALGDDKHNMIMREVQSLPKESYLESFLPILMKVSGLCNSLQDDVKTSALSLSKNLYKELFGWAQTQNKDSLVNNTLLVNLGLIKSEDKKFVPAWDVDACLVALEAAITESFFPSNTKQTLQLFLGRKTNSTGTGHKKLLETLSKH